MALNLGAFGSFLGGRDGQSGFAGGLREQDQQAKQRQQLAQLYQAIALAQQQSGAPAPNIPGASPPMAPPPALPGGNQVPPGTTPPPTGLPSASPSAGGPQVAAMPKPPGGPQPSGPGSGVPSMDKLMAAVASMPNLRDDQKMQILEQYGAFATPYEKMLQQMDLKITQLNAQSQRAQDMMENARTLAAMRIGAQERGQDLNAQNVDKRVAATERGQDITSTNKSAERDLQYDKMSGVDLRGELTSITQQLTNNPKLSAKERKDLMTQWQTAKAALDDKRKKQGLPPSKDAPPAGASTGGSGEVPTVSTQAEFDKLPSGATYKESDGNTYTKP
jgi:hypothetical protein